MCASRLVCEVRSLSATTTATTTTTTTTTATTTTAVPTTGADFALHFHNQKAAIWADTCALFVPVPVPVPVRAPVWLARRCWPAIAIGQLDSGGRRRRHSARDSLTAFALHELWLCLVGLQWRPDCARKHTTHNNCNLGSFVARCLLVEVPIFFCTCLASSLPAIAAASQSKQMIGVNRDRRRRRRRRTATTEHERELHEPPKLVANFGCPPLPPLTRPQPTSARAA